jgi:hypothetical protein
MKIILSICFFISIVNLHSQNLSFQKIISNDSIKQVQTFSKDSIIINLMIYKFQKTTNTFDLFQTINFDLLGNVSSVNSYYGKEWSEEGLLKYDVLVVDLNDFGKPKRIFFTNKFKLFRNYIFDTRKGKYKRVRP